MAGPAARMDDSLVRLASPGPVGLVGRQQPDNESNQLAGSEDNGPLVLVLTHLVELAVIESRVFGRTLSHPVCSFAQVVT